MIASQEFKKGQFTYTGAGGVRQVVPIDFNPASLDYNIAIQAKGVAGLTQQAAGAASATLTLELLFDTTDTGDDVRSKTVKVERMLQPLPPSGGRNGPPQAPPHVTFEWGAFTFSGVAVSFRQSMDFFSSNGVPLRAVVNLTLSQPNYQFDDPSGGNARGAADSTFVLGGGTPVQLALEAGNPGGARLIASANGLESLRADAGAAVAISGGVSIGAPSAFSVGPAAGASVGFQVGAAPGGADFSGLQVSSAPRDPTFAPERLLAATSAPGIAPGALFDVTGRAVAQNASTFKADVGATPRVRFDES